MYGIFTYTYHYNQRNVGNTTFIDSYGIVVSNKLLESFYTPEIPKQVQQNKTTPSLFLTLRDNQFTPFFWLLYIQCGPLLVINEVITPISGLING